MSHTPGNMKDCTHFMLDLEALSNDTRNGMLLSIGAVAFKFAELIEYPTDEEFIGSVEKNRRKFYTPISILSQERYGLSIESETLLWWLSDNNIPMLRELQTSAKLGIVEVFTRFGGWIVAQEPDIDKRRLWSHGSTYDCVHLKEKWRYIVHEVPNFNHICPFRQIRDTRTMFEMYETKFGVSPYPAIERKRKHHALEDALIQAMAVQTAIDGLLM